METNVWKTFIEIDKNEIKFEVINECKICDSKLNEEVNWKGVSDFLERLPTEIKELKSESQASLLYLARKMKFWKEEFEEKSFFYLDTIEYLSVNLSNERLEYAKFENHTFQLVFTLEHEEDKGIDTYGRWVTKWTGNQITGIKREQC